MRTMIWIKIRSTLRRKRLKSSCSWRSIQTTVRKFTTKRAKRGHFTTINSGSGCNSPGSASPLKTITLNSLKSASKAQPSICRSKSNLNSSLRPSRSPRWPNPTKIRSISLLKLSSTPSRPPSRRKNSENYKSRGGGKCNKKILSPIPRKATWRLRRLSRRQLIRVSLSARPPRPNNSTGRNCCRTPAYWMVRLKRTDPLWWREKAKASKIMPITRINRQFSWLMAPAWSEAESATRKTFKTNQWYQPTIRENCQR